MHRPVREKLPVAVPLRVDALKPDRGQARWNVRVSVLWHEQADIPSVGDRDVTVHFDLNVVEVVDEIFLVSNPFQEGGFIVLDTSSLLTSDPSVAMTEMKVAGQGPSQQMRRHL